MTPQATASSRFKATDCAALGFKPQMAMKLLGGKKVTTSSKNPGLLATLKPRTGDANIKSVKVTLTDAFQIDQRHLGNICSEKDLAANDCAGKHQVGTVTATTPLLDDTAHAVPSTRSRVPTRSCPSSPSSFTASSTPWSEATTRASATTCRPTSRASPTCRCQLFALTIDGGSGGYLVNTRDVCAATNTSLVQFTGQNGKTVHAEGGAARAPAPKRARTPQAHTTDDTTDFRTTDPSLEEDSTR